MKLRASILKKISESNRIKGLLCGALNKSMQSVNLYIENNHLNLTTAAALKVIREELDLNDEQILIEEPIHA